MFFGSSSAGVGPAGLVLRNEMITMEDSIGLHYCPSSPAPRTHLAEFGFLKMRFFHFFWRTIWAEKVERRRIWAMQSGVKHSGLQVHPE